MLYYRLIFCFFNLQRQIDKATDIIEESNNIPDLKGKSLKESVNYLKGEVKIFSEKLEETREKIEETSRCFQLLESCEDLFEDEVKEEDFQRLALKTNNDKLIQICKVSTFFLSFRIC